MWISVKCESDSVMWISVKCESDSAMWISVNVNQTLQCEYLWNV
eukprot:SAG22_NODE_13462_length_405_cov_3.637255_1_plen_43_part_01